MTVRLELDGYKLDQGLIVPEQDNRIATILHRHVGHIDLAVKYCRKRDVVVQAGGNVGMWPKRMAELFGTVYTFEPDPMNFAALCLNTAGLDNVVKMQAVLGRSHYGVDLNREVKNCGAFFVEGVGKFPTFTIDDLGLDACNLIYLDIEGCESAAIHGALNTIMDHSPVVAFEDKGLGGRYHAPQGSVQKLLESYRYRVVETANDDFIMVRD